VNSKQPEFPIFWAHHYDALLSHSILGSSKIMKFFSATIKNVSRTLNGLVFSLLYLKQIPFWQGEWNNLKVYVNDVIAGFGGLFGLQILDVAGDKM